MTVFYVLGGLLAAWALVVTALGVSRHDFPGKGGGERIVAAISIALVAGAIGAAIIGAANQEEAKGGSAEAPAQPPAGGAAEAPAQAPAGGAGSQLSLAADPSGQLKFDKTALQASAGQVTITMDNRSTTPHNVALEGNGVDKKGQVVSQGKSTVATDLRPGAYTFYCSVPGHRQAGMQGTLRVR